MQKLIQSSSLFYKSKNHPKIEKKYYYFEIINKKHDILSTQVNLIKTTIYSYFYNDYGFIEWLMSIQELKCNKCEASKKNMRFKLKPKNKFQQVDKSNHCFLECAVCEKTQSPTNGTIFAHLRKKDNNPILEKVYLLTCYIYGQILLTKKLESINKDENIDDKKITDTIWSVEDYEALSGYSKCEVNKILKEFKQIMQKKSHDKYLQVLIKMITDFLHYCLSLNLL